MLRLEIWNDDYTYHIDDIVKNINTDENLTTDLESSSSLWRVTVPRNNPDILDIIQKEDLKAVLKDVDKDHPELIYQTFFTGWVSTSFSYVIDTHGQQAVQITLEDNGVHLLKKPYTKDESFVLEGKFSSITTGDLGIVQKICDKCDITYISNIITDTTEVKTVAEAAESCESLLKSVCKEMGYVYLFNALGQLYLKPLSTSSLPTGNTVYDNSIYDSINLNRRARTYRGSRIKWTELDNKNDVLIYRVIEGQGTTHPDCYFSITNGQTLPDPQGGYTYYEASDIKNGTEIFSISNVVPEVHCPSGDGSVDYQTSPNCFVKFGAKSLKMLMTATASGHIDKLQAKASVTYVKNHNVTYGEAKDSGETVSITDNLHEEECRWIHTEAPAKKYANFLAQYDRYCSSEFTFRTDELFALGDIIHLNENLHTGLDAHLMVTRRSRTLTSYNETTRQFGGVWSYTAVSTRAFDYNRTVSEESTSIPPTSSYTQPEFPDVSDISGIQLSTDKSFLKKDLRSSATQTMNIYASVIGGLTGITVTASYSNGDSITVTPDPQVSNKWSITVPENKNVQGVNITASVDGTDINTIYVSYSDQTQYYKFLGNYSSNPTEAQANSVILVHDFYVDTTNGKTIECTGRTETQSVPTFTWSDMPLNADNANKFLIALESATQAGISLESMSNPNTVSWFNTIIATKAVIDSLFSRYITILDRINSTTQQTEYGCIRSGAYDNDGNYIGPGQGFFLNSQGILKCYSAEMNDIQAVNANISGNSSFHGSFDCTIIKTTPEDPSTYITLSPVGADGAQCKRIVDRLLNNNLIPDWANSAQASGLIPISVVGVSDIAFMKVTYQKGTRSGTTTYYARVVFYNSSGTELNVRNYSVLNVSKSGSGNWTNHLYSDNLNFGDPTNIPGEYAAQAGSTDGITIRVLTGQSRLWMSLPTANEATALTSGMLFRSVNPVSTGTTGVTGYAVYMKP